MTLNPLLEEAAQIACANLLDQLGVLWTHPANEGKHKVQYRVKQARMGMKKGVPDILIFSKSKMTHKPVALELKRARGPRGGGGGSISPEQQHWLDRLIDCGWTTKVCHGIEEATEFIARHYG